MLGLSGRAVAFYAAFAYPIALFCAIPYFDDHTQFDPEYERRRLRCAQLLVLLAPIHILFPVTALGIVRDAARLAEKPEVHAAARRRARRIALVGGVVSLAAFLAVRVVAG